MNSLSHTTLNMVTPATWSSKSTVYQKFLTVSNVLLLIFSTGLIFSSLVFLGVYHMAKVC